MNLIEKETETFYTIKLSSIELNVITETLLTARSYCMDYLTEISSELNSIIDTFCDM